jgi:hypothetical protein
MAMSISERARHRPCRTFSGQDSEGDSLVGEAYPQLRLTH